MTEMNLFLHLGDRLSPFSSRWPCIQYRTAIKAAFGGWIIQFFTHQTKPLYSARWFNSRLSWLHSFLLYVWCVWLRSTASWMRELGFCQALGRTVITCTIDTAMLIMWEQQNAAFGGRQNHFVSPQTKSLYSARWFNSRLSWSMWCFNFVLIERRLGIDKRELILDRLSPFSSRWPCTDLHNWYYNIAHVRANRMPPLGVDKTILSPPKRSLSPTRGDSSLSQLFLFIFVDVCIVYVMFLAFGGRQNVFFITLTIHTV